VATNSQQPAQAHIQESVQQPLQQLVSMEDTHICGGGSGAVEPRHPVGLKAQTVDSTQLEHTAEPPVPCRDDFTVHSPAFSASLPSAVLIQSREAVNSEAQLAPQSSHTDNSDTPRGRSWRARYQEINRRIERGYLSQAGAVELALRALSAGEAPGASRPLDSDRSLRPLDSDRSLRPLDSDRSLSNTLISHSESSPALSDSDDSTLAQSGDDQVPSRYLLRRNTHDGPELTAIAESSP